MDFEAALQEQRILFLSVNPRMVCRIDAGLTVIESPLPDGQSVEILPLVQLEEN